MPGETLGPCPVGDWRTFLSLSCPRELTGIQMSKSLPGSCTPSIDSVAHGRAWAHILQKSFQWFWHTYWEPPQDGGADSLFPWHSDSRPSLSGVTLKANKPAELGTFSAQQISMCSFTFLSPSLDKEGVSVQFWPTDKWAGWVPSRDALGDGCHQPGPLSDPSSVLCFVLISPRLCWTCNASKK